MRGKDDSGKFVKVWSSIARLKDFKILKYKMLYNKVGKVIQEAFLATKYVVNVR